MIKRVAVISGLMVAGAATGLLVSMVIGRDSSSGPWIENVSLQALPNAPAVKPFVAPILPLAPAAGSAGSVGQAVADSTSVSLPIPDAPPGPRAKDPKARIGIVTIPKLMVRSTIWYGVSERTLEKGVGWWPGSARPGGIGNLVLSGHRTTFQQPFRYLNRLAPGDTIDITTDIGTFRYRVTGTEVVDPIAVRIVAQTPERTATLFTCTPIGLDTQRLVVHARFEAQI